LRARHGFQLQEPRVVTKTDAVTGKPRTFCVFNIFESILHRALANLLRTWVLYTRANVCRSGLDARWSVARAAVLLRTSGPTHVLRLDLRKAFDSLMWRVLLGSRFASRFPALRDLIGSLLDFYRHEGIGTPLGAAFSSVLMDFALLELDLRLRDFQVVVFRYVDDVLVLVPALSDGRKQRDKIMATAAGAIAPLGLELHPAKSKSYLWPVQEPMQEAESVWVPWLGHQISLTGDIDVTEENTARFLAEEPLPSPQRLRAWQRHFVLAQDGVNYQALMIRIRERSGRKMNEK